MSHWKTELLSEIKEGEITLGSVDCDPMKFDMTFHACELEDTSSNHNFERI